MMETKCSNGCVQFNGSRTLGRTSFSSLLRWFPIKIHGQGKNTSQERLLHAFGKPSKGLPSLEFGTILPLRSCEARFRPSPPQRPKAPEGPRHKRPAPTWSRQKRRPCRYLSHPGVHWKSCMRAVKVKAKPPSKHPRVPKKWQPGPKKLAVKKRKRTSPTIIAGCNHPFLEESLIQIEST